MATFLNGTWRKTWENMASLARMSKSQKKLRNQQTETMRMARTICQFNALKHTHIMYIRQNCKSQTKNIFFTLQLLRKIAAQYKSSRTDGVINYAVCKIIEKKGKTIKSILVFNLWDFETLKRQKSCHIHINISIYIAWVDFFCLLLP